MTIAAVLEALAQLATDALTPSVPGAVVRQQRPQDGEDLVCLHVLRLAPSETTVNRPLPDRRAAPTPALTAQVDVLLSFHGHQGPTMAAAVLTALHQRPVLIPDGQPVQVQLQPLTLTDLSAIWAMLDQPHSPCLLYRLGPVPLSQ